MKSYSNELMKLLAIMMGRNFGLLFFLLFLFQNTIAQETLVRTDNDALYQQGVELILKEQYGAARKMFDDYLSNQPEALNKLNAEYYRAYASLRLYNTDGEKLINEFVEQNPTHPKALLAYYELGTFYFRDKKYRKAIQYFEKANLSKLSVNQQLEARFKLGYAHFSFREFEQAKKYFDIIKRQDNHYTHAASYYSGYIAYQNKNYDQALYDFEKASENEAYDTVVPYLIANIYYNQGRYDELVAYGKNALEIEGVKDREGISILIGDAYYQKRNYAQAILYLQEAAEGTTLQNDPKIFYKLAYAQYQTDKTNEAIESFKKVALLPDSLGQYSSYYLGILYLKNDQKQYAVNAFERAMQDNHVPQIKQEATYQFAKVNFDLNRFAEAIAILKQYLVDFKNGAHVQDANELLGEAYLRTTNYDLAIQHIESLPQQSESIRRVYQKVTFYKGTELFNQGRYPQAVELFEKAADLNYDQEIVVQAHYWAGEAYSIGNRYEEAINEYAAVFRNSSSSNPFYLKARYGIGYAYFNTQQYEKALPHFKAYVEELRNSPQKYFYNDALIRLADCYYVNKTYQSALQVYKQAIAANHPDKDYANYQVGVVQGLIDNPEAAKSSLDVVINNYPNSPYHDDALFEKAQISFELGSYQQAVATFSNLMNRHPQSPYVPFALLRRALANANLQNYEQTEADYKRILDQYITHEVSNSALLGLQEALTRQGNTDQFDIYLARYKQANPDNKNLQSIEFESAKNLYFSQKYEAAVKALNDYLRAYPQSATTYEARYYLAESYYRANQFEKALPIYQQLATNNSGEYYNRVIQRVADIEIGQENFVAAIDNYRKLSNAAQNKKEQYFAWSGLMEAYFSQQVYDSASYFATQILEKASVSANATNRANLYLGKAAYQQRNYDQAIDQFIRTLNTAKDVNGAEAQYLMADIFYKQGNYNQSLETLFNLNSNFGAYEEWINKSFLLIAENYLAMDETFQAKATLKSIVEKSPIPEVRDQARKRLNEIEAEEKANLQQDTSFMQPLNE